ncbi:MAG: DUF488 domain-containing protein [Anaerolineae bacterium]|nr:DUF488 domain-containing protein [Anaerolineae bacterium]
MTRPTLYTIGHSNTTLPVFVALLRQHAITVLADVRSAPFSRYVPHFNKPRLEADLPDRAIAYYFYGKTLGGRPTDTRVYDDGQVNYSAIMTRDWYRAGLRDLLARVMAAHDSGGRVAIMCAERDPLGCHRHNLVARSLIDPQVREMDDPVVDVAHILADGSLRVVTAADFDAPQQLTLL